MENEVLPTKEESVVPVADGSACQKCGKCGACEKKLLKEALLVAGAVLLGSLIIAGSILTLSPQGATKGTGTAQGTQQAAPGNQDTSAVTSIDDDPVLGDKKKAKVAIVEYSDYECPFCKKFHADTFDALVKNYVDTGKAIVVFRDFPLSFHDPNATIEAATAECVRKEKGDTAYFAFAKALYENTQTNGKGLVAGKLDELIGKVGANAKTVATCSATDAVKEEIQKDIADGGKAGISGTPSFVIGKLESNGTVTGERVVGAQSIDGFKLTIEKYLK